MENIEEERTSIREETVDDKSIKNPEGEKSVTINIIIIFTIVVATLIIIIILLCHLVSPFTATYNRKGQRGGPGRALSLFVTTVGETNPTPPLS